MVSPEAEESAAEAVMDINDEDVPTVADFVPNLAQIAECAIRWQLDNP